MSLLQEQRIEDVDGKVKLSQLMTGAKDSWLLSNWGKRSIAIIDWWVNTKAHTRWGYWSLDVLHEQHAFPT